MSKAGITAALASVAAAGSLAGCAMFNEGALHYTRTTTLGKELVDLQEARDKGALSEEEYAKAKKDLLAGAPLDAGLPCAKEK